MRFLPIVFLFLFTLNQKVKAQIITSPATGLAVDSAQNIFGCPTDSGQVKVVSIQFEGNNQTKEKVLRAELDLKEGEQLNQEELRKRLEENRLRLYNLQLFHYVRYIAICDQGGLNLIFSVQERRYIWPSPIISFADRNLNAWIEHRDLRWFDYGLHLLVKNFRGLNQTVDTTSQHGYNQRYDFLYTKPAVNRRKLGTIFRATYYRSHAVDYITLDNKLNTLWQDSDYPIERYSLSQGLLYRPDVQRQTALTFTYNWQNISDSAFALNPDYFLGRKERQYGELSLVHTRNFRNTFSYPLSGSYFQIGLSQRLYTNKSGDAATTLRIKYTRYIPVQKNWYYSFGVDGRSTFSRRLPYADNLALGYGSTVVRGYQLFVIGGQQLGLVKQSLSRTLMPQQEVVLPFIKSPKFNRIPVSLYLNAFADAGYTRDKFYAETNDYTNYLLASAGIGLHIVTYYDKVITLEYTLNKAGQTGFFINTGIPF